MSLVQNRYIVNVCLHNKHLFTTSEHSAVTMHDLKRLLPILLQKFPVSEGFRVSTTKCVCHGENLSKAEMNELECAYTGHFHDAEPKTPEPESPKANRVDLQIVYIPDGVERNPAGRPEFLTVRGGPVAWTPRGNILSAPGEFEVRVRMPQKDGGGFENFKSHLPVQEQKEDTKKMRLCLDCASEREASWAGGEFLKKNAYCGGCGTIRPTKQFVVVRSKW